YGHIAIVRRLTAEKVPPIGTAAHWARSYVCLLLKDRRAVGELQPKTRGGKPDGPPVPGYYPAVVSEEEWQAARVIAAGRRPAPRQGKPLDLFSGLVRNARDGDSYHTATTFGRGVRYRVLVNGAGVAGRGTITSFPQETFERAVLSLLAEVDP